MPPSDRPPWLTFAFIAFMSAAATGGTMLGLQSLSKRRRRRQLDEDALASISASRGHLNSLPEPTREEPKQDEYTKSEDLIREQLARNYAFYGEEGMRKIRGSTVVIVGCGGVGSSAALSLARSGVGRLRLIDFDYVTLSSLNRHATATLADVGTPKVNAIATALHQIARFVEIEPRIELWRADSKEAQTLLEGADWVIDAIDNISTKVALIAHCKSRDIPVFAAMGAGAKEDPTRIQIADISSTVYDPLARSVRRRLRAEHNIVSGVPVVYSSEVQGDVRLLPLPEDEFAKGNVQELAPFDDFRVRILPVIGPLPSLFGLHAAAYVLGALAGKPILNPLPVRHRHKLYDKLLRDLMVRERGTEGGRLPIDASDVGFIVEDLHRGGRSLVPPHNIPRRPVLVRWDKDEPLSLDNCVLLDAISEEVNKHLAQGPAAWNNEVHDIVNRRRREVEQWRKWVM